MIFKIIIINKNKNKLKLNKLKKIINKKKEF
jgi:hypothetical protein